MLRPTLLTVALSLAFVPLAACMVGDETPLDDATPGPSLVIEPGESLADHGLDLTDQEADEILAVVVTTPPAPSLARAGTCLGIALTDHVRQKHVGKTDAQLRDRAAQNGINASSWKTDASALRALKNLINFRCSQMLAWQETAAVGAASTWFKSNTGETGRLCRPSGTCSNVLGATAVYTKRFHLFGFTISFLTTAYPVT